MGDAACKLQWVQGGIYPDAGTPSRNKQIWDILALECVSLIYNKKTLRNRLPSFQMPAFADSRPRIPN